MMPSVIGHPVRLLLLLVHDDKNPITKDASRTAKIIFFIVFYLVELFCIFIDAKL
jgi:hypothetical protein